MVELPDSIKRVYDFEKGYAHFTSMYNRFGIIDKTGEIIIPANYIGGALVTSDGNNVFFYYSEGQSIFISDEQGKQIGCLYDNSRIGFKNGLCAVKLNGKWGYIDIDFNEVIPCQYDSCHSFSGELAKVFMKGKTFLIESYINKDNKVVWQKLIKND